VRVTATEDPHPPAAVATGPPSPALRERVIVYVPLKLSSSLMAYHRFPFAGTYTITLSRTAGEGGPVATAAGG